MTVKPRRISKGESKIRNFISWWYFVNSYHHLEYKGGDKYLIVQRRKFKAR